MTKEFKKEVEIIINRLGIDNLLNTQDYIISEYLANSLEVLSILLNDKDDQKNKSKKGKGE